MRAYYAFIIILIIRFGWICADPSIYLPTRHKKLPIYVMPIESDRVGIVGLYLPIKHPASA
jgi:hypothetical protein